MFDLALELTSLGILSLSRGFAFFDLGLQGDVVLSKLLFLLCVFSAFGYKALILGAKFLDLRLESSLEAGR